MRWSEHHRGVFDFFEAPVIFCNDKGFLGHVSFYEASKTS